MDQLNCLHSKSASLSEIGFMATTCSVPFLSLKHLGIVGFSHEFASCRGSSLTISCSATSNGAYLSEKINNLAGKEKIVAENYLYGTNGANGNLFLGNVGVLDSFDDEYGGVVVDSNRLPINSDDFIASLHLSLSHWKIMGRNGVWLKLPLERSELVPFAVKQGFQYHHAESGYVMLTYWLPEGPCMLPSNATHQVGVGAFVINPNNEDTGARFLKLLLAPIPKLMQDFLPIKPNLQVLVVQEKFCSTFYEGHWKIPTGFIHESEEIYTGVVREVKEETGIDTEFIEVVAFRHAPNLAFDKSDLFFVCMLKSLSTQISVDDLEVKAAKWMPLAKFVKQPLIEGDSMFKKITDICVARLRKRYCGLSAETLPSMFDGRQSNLYYNVVDDRRDGNLSCSEN